MAELPKDQAADQMADQAGDQAEDQAKDQAEDQVANQAGSRETPGNPEKPKAVDREAEARRILAVQQALQQAQNNLRKPSGFDMAKQMGQGQNTNVAVNCCSIIFIVVLAVILDLHDGDCDTPIRLWLTVYMWALVGQSLFLGVCNLIMKCGPQNAGCVGMAMMIVNLLTALFFLVWWIIGNVWYFDIDGCDDFQEGYDLALVFLIFGYLGVFGCCCGICCCVCCLVMGVSAAKAAELAKKAEEQEIEQLNDVSPEANNKDQI